MATKDKYKSMIEEQNKIMEEFKTKTEEKNMTGDANDLPVIDIDDFEN